MWDRDADLRCSACVIPVRSWNVTATVDHGLELRGREREYSILRIEKIYSVVQV